MNPYTVLGVRRNATTAKIQKAFRARARAAHPDAGGDAAQFQELHRAYKVLMDKGRRAHYDQTGDMGSDIPDNEDAALMSALSAVLVGVLQYASLAGQKPARQDFAELMRQSLRDGRAKAEKALESLERGAKDLRSLQGRFSQELCESLLRGQLAAVAQAREKVTSEIAQLDKALAAIKDLRFDAEGHPSPGWGQVTNVSNGPVLMKCEAV